MSPESQSAAVRPASQQVSAERLDQPSFIILLPPYCRRPLSKLQRAFPFPRRPTFERTDFRGRPYSRTAAEKDSQQLPSTRQGKVEVKSPTPSGRLEYPPSGRSAPLWNIDWLSLACSWIPSPAQGSRQEQEEHELHSPT